MSSTPPYAQSPDVVGKDAGGDFVLVHLQTNKVYELNRTGARLWQLIGEGLSPQEAEGELSREFDVDAATVHAEVKALVEGLLAESLLIER